MQPDPSLIRPVAEYTIGWICALSLEQTASGSVLDNIHSYRGHPDVPLDENNIYILGSIGAHNIVIATLPKGLYGNTRAAVVAARLTSFFRSIKFLFMVGIGGGIPNIEEGADIRLGDVVVSVPEGKHSGVVKWDMGKTEKGSKFNRTGALDRPPEKLLNAVNNLQFRYNLFGSNISKYVAEVHQRYPNLQAFSYLGPENDTLYQADYEHEDEKNRTCYECDSTRTVYRKPRTHTDPVVHYGIIASGDQVIKDAPTRDALRKELKAKCVEMEGAGTMDAFPCLVVRGICDYSDSHKNKDWQPYAALTAAAYAKELLEVLPTQDVAVLQPAQEVQVVHGQSKIEVQRDLKPLPPGTDLLIGGAETSSTARSRSPAGRIPRDGKMTKRADNNLRISSIDRSPHMPKNDIRSLAGPSAVRTPLRSLVIAPPPVAPLPSKLRRYFIAAANWDTWTYRLYFQTSQGIFEAKRDEEEWKITQIPGINAVQYTPLAVVARRKGQDIRLFYLSPDSVVQEHRYTGARGWYPGTLDALQIRATLSSRLAAVEWSGNIRVYYQGYNNDKIEELRYMDTPRGRSVDNVKGWERGLSLRTALRGTSIAAAGYISDNIKIHVFYQDERFNMRELMYNGVAYNEGSLIPSLLPDYTSLTTCALFMNSTQIMVFGKSKDGTLLEFSGDEMGTWTKRSVDIASFSNIEPALAVTMSGPGRKNLFVYRGEGEIVEECWASDGSDWFNTLAVTQ